MADYSNEPQNGTLNDSNKVSLYTPADNLSDFPVLKAFRQYINEEQIKAQKRMTLLCALFVAILCVVVAVFAILLTNANNDNSRLNDRLLQLALKSTDSAENPSASDRSLKTLTDSISQIQSQMGEQQAKLIKEQQSLFEERLKMLTNAKSAENKTEAASPRQIAADAEKKNRQIEERLRKEMEAFKKEKERLVREKEELRQQQIELQRRKLYPEYYNQATNKAPSQPEADGKAQTPSQQGFIDYFGQYEEDGDSEAAQAPAKTTERVPVRNDKSAVRKPKVSDPKPAYDNLTIKSEAGESIDWQIPYD